MPSFSQALNYLCYRDVKSSGTNGGDFTSGSWQTRTLNEETVDYGTHGSLSGNKIRLDFGTYICRASAPAVDVGEHQARLWNDTDSATLLVGTSEYSSSAASYAQTRSIVVGVFTVGNYKDIILQHQCTTTKATNGFGVAGGFTDEVYAVVELWKIG